MLRTIDRYIIKELSDPFLFGLGAFSAILASSTVMFELVRAVIIKGMPITVAIQLFIFRLPGVMVYIFPMATLLAALMAFSRLSNDSEIVAFKAAGVSLYRLIIPVLLLGFVISLVTLFFYEVVVPEANQAATNLVAEASARHNPKIQKNMLVPELEHGELKRIFYARQLEGDVMEGVVIGEFEGHELVELVNAKEASWQKDKNRWVLKDGIIYILSETGEYKHLIRFREQFITIKYTPSDFYLGEKKAEEMNISELNKFIAIKRNMGEDVTDYEIQLNLKLAIPFACLVFALLGAPLGLTPKRASSSIGLGLSIIVIFLYYIIMSVSVAFGELRWLSPFISAWVPNLATGGIGWYFLDRSVKS
jgi:lipopolysaccharide export system permease protein